MANLIGQSLGRYHILEQLGEGGMATVYKAYDTRLERDVAIKIIRREVFSPIFLERVLKRFEREAKALAKLTHPNIVHVHDYGEHEGAPFLVMEYLPGGTLKQRLGKPMPWQEAVRILLPIAQALEYAHEHNIVHRDIKPANILLTEKGQPMLSDFGIAKILESEDAATLTGTGVGVGTPEYMAPEQWTGQAGPQADLYSLGVVLYELVTGRKPYTADTPAAVLLKQATEPLPRPAQFVAGLPEPLEKVLFKAMAKKPEDRYPDMAAFVHAMEALLASFTRFAAPVALSPDRQLPELVEYAQETRKQKATRDEIPDAAAAPVGKDSFLPKSPFAKKRDQRIRVFWMGGGILIVLAGFILIGLWVKGNMGAARPASTPTSTITNSPMPSTRPTMMPAENPTANPATMSSSAPAEGETILPAPTGKLLWSDDFNDGFSNGFSFWTGGWKVVDDGTGNKVLQMDSPLACCAGAKYGPDSLSDGIVEIRFRVISAEYQAPNHVVEFGFRNKANNNGPWTEYSLVYDPEWSSLSLIYQENSGPWQSLEGNSGGGAIQTQDGGWITLRIEFQGKNIRVFVDGNLFLTAEDSRDNGGAFILGGLGPVIAQFDDLKVWDFGTK